MLNLYDFLYLPNFEHILGLDGKDKEVNLGNSDRRASRYERSRLDLPWLGLDIGLAMEVVERMEI